MGTVKVRVTYDLLAAILKGYEHRIPTRVTTNVPADAKIVDIGADWNDRILGAFWCVMQSASFADVPEGNTIPEFDVVSTATVIE